MAVISVSALAFGYLIMNLFGASANLSGDVCSILFGTTSILTLTQKEVWICAVLSLAVVVIFILFYNRIFSVTFDEDFARATGTNADAYNLMLAVIIAVIIVLAMNLVGSLLISALVIFPALSAVFSVVCALLGIIISILAGTPVGSTIVAADAVAFGLCCAVGVLRRNGGK